MRLIDADDVLDSIENWKRKVLYYHPHTKKFSTIPLSEVMSFLEDSPTIDAVPVVRCRDCKWWGDLDPKNRYTDCYCHVVECSTEPDWFCADGERRDDGE